MSTRLNTDIRNQIVRNAIDAQFNPLYEAHNKALGEMGRRVYEHCVPAEARKLIEKLAAYNPSKEHTWILSPSSITVVTAHDGHQMSLDTAGKVPCPRFHSYNAPYRIKDRKLCDEVVALVHAGEDLKNKRHAASNALHKALRGVATLERLFERWPEGKKFYASPPLKKPLPVPAVRFAEVNVMLGLA